MYCTLAVLAMTFGAWAQDETAEDDTPKEGWTRKGVFSFLFNQAAFNAEWQAGGVSSIAGNASINYDFNYYKNEWSWDNKLIAAYGLTKIKTEENVIKTDDRLEFNSLLGRKAGGNWYYSFFLNFKTQMDVGFIEGEQSVTAIIDGENQSISIPTRERNTEFLSPAFLQIGPGMLWKKSDNLKVNIAPATAKFIFVDQKFTDPNGPFSRLTDGAYFGVEAGETSRFELGASISGYYKFTIVENVTWENILNLYSNYLEDPQNVDLDYTANIAMKVNDFISANLSFQTIYDDNAIKGFQVREVFGVGFNYNF